MAVKVVIKSQKAAGGEKPAPRASQHPEYRETFMNRFFKIMLMDIRNRFDPHYRKELEKFNEIVLRKQ